jgi:diaminohydroxyphosphoribosylaminopyrimidine deaminase / 5-amino-6-(5-phosphoribosylamino)uracil reductase
MALSADELFLRQALELAARGTGLASPNPLVGALVVDERGRIVGSGTHLYDGRKHAEILALEQAGPLARGNTLYLNLEPCSHTGRTGPCAEAVIAAGVARVVCCMQDPNPLVAGKGFHKLREAGIEVAVGGLEAEARRLNESFARFIRTALPLVTLKAAMSLDGKIAGPSAGSPFPSATASSSYITGEAARARVHRMRHASDAILVGVGTILADDPLLTDRSGLPRRRRLLRVILDSRLRIPLASRIVETADNDVAIFCATMEDNAEETKRRALESRGVQVFQVESKSKQVETGQAETEPVVTGQLEAEPRCGKAEAASASRPVRGETATPGTRPDLHRVLATLGASQITSLLVEGGAEVNWACLRAGVVDKLVLFYTPRIFGPVGTVPWLTGQTALPGDSILRPFRTSLEHFDEDFAVEAYLRDPYDSPNPQTTP